MNLLYIVMLLVLKKVKISSCYLYPYESESRETRSLNGLWDFKISPEDNMDIGFTDAWYTKEFLEVKYVGIII